MVEELAQAKVVSQRPPLSHGPDEMECVSGGDVAAVLRFGKACETNKMAEHPRFGESRYATH